MVRRRVSIDCGGESLTKQSFKAQCDINKIIAKYRQTGLINHLSARPGMFEDVSEMSDYHASLNKVRQADVLFMGLPSNVRERFKNDPGNLVEFLMDSKNRDEAVKLGLILDKSKVGGQGSATPSVEPKAAV